jgi:hypothetical protein
VDPWGPEHFLEFVSEQSGNVETMEGHWKTFLALKLDSPSSGKIRVLEPYLGIWVRVVGSCRKVCLTSQLPHEGGFPCNITSCRIK